MGTLGGTARKERGARHLFHRAELLHLVGGAEGDGDAVRAVALGSAVAMDLGLGLVMQVLVDVLRHARHVDAALNDVGGD
jgi:hypothetical protein